MSRRGIILAGGSGTRLYPLTKVISKQLLPVFDKPMIYYPLSTLMIAGIRDILIITTPHDNENFVKLLGDGGQWGLNLSYAVQKSPDGLAQSFIIGADFIHGHRTCLILGDNIIYGDGLSAALQGVSASKKGATIFGYAVEEPQHYGVIEFDAAKKAVSLEEKPKTPKSNWAAIGIYFYDENVVSLARSIKPSDRGELEITDLNMLYLRAGLLNVECLGRGYAWFDAGTHQALLEAGEFIRVLQSRQGQLIASPEEIAYRNGWITYDDLARATQLYENTSYGRMLRKYLNA